MPASPTLTTAWHQAETLCAQGDLRSAREVLEPAAEVATMAYGPDHPDVIETQRRLALVYRDLGDLASARRVLEEALAGGLLRFGDADALMLSVSAQLGEVAEQLGNRHEARRNFARVMQYGPQVLGHDHPQVRAAQSYLGGESAGPVYIPPPRPEAPATLAPTTLAPTTVTPETVTPETVTPETVTPATPAPEAPREETPTTAPEAPREEPPSWPPREREQEQEPREREQEQEQPAVPPPPVAPPSHRPVLVPEAEPGVWRPEPAARPAARRPSAREPGGRTWVRIPLIVLAVVATAALAAASVLAIQAFLAPPRSAGNGTGTGASAAPSIPVLTPPGEVNLRDNGDSVTLTWKDPDAGTLPFIVSGGRAGEQSHPYPPLPAGQTTFTINGLNASVDYCFTVVAVYTTDEFAPSNLVCTRREATPQASASR